MSYFIVCYQLPGQGVLYCPHLGTQMEQPLSQRLSIAMKVNVLVSQLCLTLQLHGLEPSRLLCPWDFPGENTWSG